MIPQVLAPSDTSVLERLTLRADPSAIRPSAGGVRRTRGRGAGTEFHEFRPYQPGDDLRAIDWTVEARLHQLVVRVPRAHGHVRLHVLLDVSASMSIGTPTKLECAQRMAAALCYVAARHRDAAGVSTFRDRISSFMPPAEGRPQLLRILELLGTQSASGASAIDRALEQYASATSGPGLAVVLSDFFEPGAARGLQYLLHRGLRPVVLQVVAPEEIDPALPPDAELVDIERPAGERLVVDAGAVRAYQAALARHETSLRALCAAHRCAFARLVSNAPFHQAIAALEDVGVIGTGDV